MSSKFSTFICQNCGTETSQYFGRCVNCNEWNTIVEERKKPRSTPLYSSAASDVYKRQSTKVLSSFRSAILTNKSRKFTRHLIFD